MTLALVALSMAGYIIALHRRYVWPLPTIPLVLVTGFIGALYIAGLIDFMRPVRLAIVVAGLALLVVAAFRSRRSTTTVSKVPSGIVVFIFCAGLLAWRLQGAAFGEWDEFSHWGLVSKEVVATHRLISADSAVLFKDYPPGAALFHYLATFGSEFSESRAYMAQAIMVFAGFSAMCAASRWPLTIAMFLLGYFGLFVFARGVESLEVDQVVAALFGCGLGAYWVSDDRSAVVRAIPVAFALPLIKSVGLLLGVFMTALIACDQLVRAERSWRQLAAVLLLVASPWIASRTWQSHVEAMHVPPTFAFHPSLAQVVSSLSPNDSTARDRVTVNAFRTALTSQPVGPPVLAGFANYVLAKWGITTWAPTGLTVCHWALVVASFWSLLLILQADRQALVRQVLALVWLVACAICFGFGLLLLYLFSFGEYEGTRLASFSRYFGVVIFGAALVTFAFLLQLNAKGRRGAAAIPIICFFTAGMTYVAPAEAARLLVEGPKGLTDFRSRVQQVISPALTHVEHSKRIYLISVGSSGFDFYLARYELAPRQTNSGCWSLGPPRFAGDVWSCGLSVEEFARTLREFDFVLLGPVDDTFWTEYGTLFGASKLTGLFKVEKDKGLRLVAEPVH
jgi:hypothetical protein